MNKYIKRIKNELIPLTTNAITTLELEENKSQKQIEVHGAVFIKKKVPTVKTLISAIDNISDEVCNEYMDDEEGMIDKCYYELGERVEHWFYTINFEHKNISKYIQDLKQIKEEMIGVVKKYENI